MWGHCLRDNPPPVVTGAELPWHTGTPLSADAFRLVREETIFGCFKWDAQVGDVSVLHDTPLVLRAPAWARLAQLAEELALETIEAERELRCRPELQRQLGLGWGVCRALRGACADFAESPFRVLRFDFHWTDEGWRLSEVNSDVPGGFIEASGFTRLVADCSTGAVATGDPAATLGEALMSHVGPAARIGLVHATAYTDDRQVMLFLAEQLQQRGFEQLLLSPVDVRWDRTGAVGHDGTGWRELDAVFRFFPGEWLPNLGWFRPWPRFFRGSPTPHINPPTALLTQSKRFPLVWDAMNTALPQWRRHLPATCDPRKRTGPADDWVLKPALGRVGDSIDICGATPPAERARIQRAARQHPAYWAAQRRFRAVPWSTSRGELFPAIGVYVIDGRTAGIYARAAPCPLVDASAFDIAALVETVPGISAYE